MTIPILPSADFDATAAFYRAFGFVERGRWPGEYLILRGPAEIELHFWMNPDLDPLNNAGGCYVRFDSAGEAEALHQAWSACDVSGGRLHPPAVTDYGMLEFALIDRSGNLLRIGGPQSTATRASP